MRAHYGVTAPRVAVSIVLVGTILVGYHIHTRPRVLNSGVSELQLTKATETEDDDALLIPNDALLNNMTDVELVSLFSRYTNSIQTICHNMDRFGPMLTDGGKEVCTDSFVKIRKPCLVYSFGSQNNFQFEDDVIRVYQCEVHTFDPSMKHLEPNKIKNPKGCTFYHIGLGDKNEIKGNKWEIRTLDTIRDMLGHTKRIIDLLKIDVEGSEWSSLAQMKHSGTLKYVRQLVVEFHFWRNQSKLKHAEWLATFRHLYDAGFRIFNRERVIYPGGIGFVKELNKKIAYQVELCFVNIKFGQ